MISDRTPRSAKYQYLIREVNFSADVLSYFSNEQSIAYRLDPFKYDEEILLLEDQLKEKLRNVCKERLTERQYNVLKMHLDGYTQIEIAKALNVNQSSVNKCINGNSEYGKRKGRIYGGLIKKLRRILSEDSDFQNILKRIDELREDKY